MKQIKVLIVDDSALIRKLLTEILEQDPQITVVGTAEDPYVAREKIKALSPDVLTLDIEMPKMDGIAFLKNLMRLRPMPVVMISTLTDKGAPATLEALSLGAVDYLAKPKTSSGESLQDYAIDIIEKIKAAATVTASSLDRLRQRNQEKAPIIKCSGTVRPGFVAAIGASTGGTEAIKEVLIALPEECPPIVVTQHIPAAFSTSFAHRMNSLSRITVYEAADGQRLMPGCAYIAPGDDHLLVVRGSKPGEFLCRLQKSEPVNRHRPAVDVLFESVATLFGKNAVGVLLTGMGTDGAKGLLRMKEAGALTYAQDEATSVVWGMPGAAVKMGAHCDVLPLQKVAGAIMAAATRKVDRQTA